MRLISQREKLMGRASRNRPKRLGEKLRNIRTELKLTQAEMAKKLAIKSESLQSSSISLFELGKREPSSQVLLAYSRIAGVTINDLVDDKIKL
jgi:transcriptional regulator with XRE-family HTH domain